VLAGTLGDGADLLGFLCKRAGIVVSELEPHRYEWHDEEAVRHLFRVSSSLDSMVFGESQILGQVKRSYIAAKTAGTIRTELDRLLPQAFTVAKRVRSKTAIGSSSVSIASVAVEMAMKIFGSLQETTVLLVGAGKMSELAARHLLAHGAKSVIVANRSFEHARTLASAFHGRAIPFEDIYDACHEADIVITATGAESAIFRREHGEMFLKRRKSRPMCFIDIAVPRNVDPQLGELEGIFVYDIDALQQFASANAQKRQVEAEQAEAIVDSEVKRFYSRLDARRAAPTILLLQSHFESIRQGELQRIRGRLGGLSQVQQAALESLTRGMVNKLIHAPLVALRQADDGSRNAMVRLLRSMYQLDGPQVPKLRPKSAVACGQQQQNPALL